MHYLNIFAAALAALALLCGRSADAILTGSLNASGVVSIDSTGSFIYGPSDSARFKDLLTANIYHFFCGYKSAGKLNPAIYATVKTPGSSVYSTATVLVQGNPMVNPNGIDGNGSLLFIADPGAYAGKGIIFVYQNPTAINPSATLTGLSNTFGLKPKNVMLFGSILLFTGQPQGSLSYALYALDAGDYTAVPTMVTTASLVNPQGIAAYAAGTTNYFYISDLTTFNKITVKKCSASGIKLITSLSALATASPPPTGPAGLAVSSDGKSVLLSSVNGAYIGLSVFANATGSLTAFYINGYLTNNKEAGAGGIHRGANTNRYSQAVYTTSTLRVLILEEEYN